MKLSFQSKLHIIVIFLLVLLILHFIFVVSYTHQSDLAPLIKDRIISLEYIFLFMGIILGLVLYFYIPVTLKKTLTPIERVFEEISKGRFNITLPEELRKTPVILLVKATNQMIENIKAFDESKKRKVLQYQKRLQLVTENIDDGVIITDEKDEIVLINTHARKLLGIPPVEEDTAFDDFHLEGEVKKYFDKALSKKTLMPEEKIYFPRLKKHVIFRNGILHDEQGNIAGIVFVIAGLDLKKLYSPPDQMAQKSPTDAPTKNSNE
ncbi:MAG: PAS domain-containing protein [Candidatus Cloacimonadia bacterium]